MLSLRYGFPPRAPVRKPTGSAVGFVEEDNPTRLKKPRATGRPTTSSCAPDLLTGRELAGCLLVRPLGSGTVLPGAPDQSACHNVLSPVRVGVPRCAGRSHAAGWLPRGPIDRCSAVRLGRTILTYRRGCSRPSALQKLRTWPECIGTRSSAGYGKVEFPSLTAIDGAGGSSPRARQRRSCRSPKEKRPFPKPRSTMLP